MDVINSHDTLPLPDGCFPTVITPMKEDGTIDYCRLKALTEWYIRSGCTGLFANCLSSEMFQLNQQERIEVTRTVKRKAGSRVAVVSSGGLNCNSLEEQAAFINLISKECDAVVVVVNQMAAEHEDESVWKRNVENLLQMTGNVRLGLYECPKPYHRCLSPELLAWAASTGRFYFHKDTCCQTEPIKKKLELVQALDRSVSFRFYNANVATLLMSLQHGGSGFSGISANFYPQLLVWMSSHAGHDQSHYVQDMLSIFENVVADMYPASAKVFQNLFEGFEGATTCRCMHTTLNEERCLKLAALHRIMAKLSHDLNLEVLNPAMFLNLTVARQCVSVVTEIVPEIHTDKNKQNRLKGMFVITIDVIVQCKYVRRRSLRYQLDARVDKKFL
eukprot:gene9518-1752_t